MLLSLLLLAFYIQSTLQQQEHRCGGRLCSQSQPICCKKAGSAARCVSNESECMDGVVICNPQTNCTQLITSKPFCCKPQNGGDQMRCVSSPQQCKQQPCGFQSCTKEAPHCCGEGLAARCIADPSSCVSGLRCGKTRCFPAAPYCCQKKGHRPKCTATIGDCHKCGTEICYPDSADPICCLQGAIPYCANSTQNCVFRRRCRGGNLCPIGASHCCSSTLTCVKSSQDCPALRPRSFATAPMVVSNLATTTPTTLIPDLLRQRNGNKNSKFNAIPRRNVSSNQTDVLDQQTTNYNKQTETVSFTPPEGVVETEVVETSKLVTQPIVTTTATRKTTPTIRTPGVKKTNNYHGLGRLGYIDHPELFVEDDESHQQHITIVTVVVCIGGVLCVLILIKSLKQYKRKRQTASTIDERLDPHGRQNAFQSANRMSIHARRYR